MRVKCMDRKNTFLMELNIFLRGRKDMTSARMVDIAGMYLAGAAKGWFAAISTILADVMSTCTYLNRSAKS